MKIRVGLAFVVLVGCSAGDDPQLLEDESDALTESELESTAACPRMLAAADRTRKVVVSHPYGDNPNRYEVLDLDRTGTLTTTGVGFEMGRSNEAPIAFTPDGRIGLAAVDGGKIGVFRFDAAGRPSVVNPGFDGGFYAHAITVNSTGTRAYALDADSAAHGGGVYELVIGCDGTLTSPRLVVPGGTAHALAFMPNNRRRAVLSGGKAFASTDGMDTFLLDLNRPALVAQGASFEDHSSIASSIAITSDSRYALIADGGINVGNRVAVVSLPSMKLKQVLETRAPFALQTSPFDDAALIVNGDSADELTTARYDRADAETPFKLTGPLAYTTARPQLPGAAVQITRGALKGRVLIAELVAIRQVQFQRGGQIDDVSQKTWEKTFDNIVGTVGVQP